MLQDEFVPKRTSNKHIFTSSRGALGSSTCIGKAIAKPLSLTESKRMRGGLSTLLRSETASEHLAVERCTGSPDSIKNVQDYQSCLRGLLSIWRPLEQALPSKARWPEFPIACSLHKRTPLLEFDLRTLGDDPDHGCNPVLRLPQSEAEWVGAVYVLEGSALGGRVIQSSLIARLGSVIADATSFYSGHSSGSHPSWRDIVLAIDAYGVNQPARQDDVIKGARHTFETFLETFACDPCQGLRP